MLTTHGHEDHIGAVADMVDATNAPFAIHENDVYMLEKAPRLRLHNPRVP